MIGLGSDVAGSCRLPAMFVGVYGHKPTPFVCSPYGHNPQSDDPRWGTFFTTAPMTRYAEDLALLLDAVREEDGPKVEILKEIDVSKIRLFYMPGDGSGMTRPLDKCIKDSLLKVAHHFNAEKVNLKLMKWSLDISMCAMLTMPFDTIYTKTEDGRKQKTSGKEILKYMFGRSESILPSVIISTFQYFTNHILPAKRHRQMTRIKNQLKQEIIHLLGENGVLIYPTFPTAANKHFEIYYKLLDTSYCMVFNTLGLPVTQVHTGFNKHNLPIGVQLVCAPNMDHLSLNVAREIQKTFGGWISACEIDKANVQTEL